MSETKYQLMFRLHDNPSHDSSSILLVASFVYSMFDDDEDKTRVDRYLKRVNENPNFFDGYSCLVTWKQLQAFANCFYSPPGMLHGLLSPPYGVWKELWKEVFVEERQTVEPVRLDYDAIWREAPEEFQK